MMTGMVHDQNLEKQIEKQMGCMTGFLQLFDRNQMLTGKRLYTTKRLPSTAAVNVYPEPEKSVETPAISRELERPHPAASVPSPSPDRSKPSPARDFRSPATVTALPEVKAPKSPLPLPIFEVKEGTKSSWKFCKEAPRLSLDSRAIVDAKGSLYPREIRTNASILSANRGDSAGDGVAVDGDDKQIRSPSVIARLMGLEPLPQHSSPHEPIKKAELRRSASESRVSRDLFQSRFIDGNNFQAKQPSNGTNITSNVIRENVNSSASNARPADPVEYSYRNAKSVPPKASNRGGGGPSPPWRSHQHRKSFFDTADIFPEPKQTMSIDGEIERRLRIRGIDEPSKDSDTLKQILEALQLKGLLHSKRAASQISQKNYVYDRSFSFDESPIVVMKPWRSQAPVSPVNRRGGNDSPPASFRYKSGARHNVNNTGSGLQSPSPKMERQGIDRNARSPTRGRNSASPVRNEGGVKSSSSILKKKPLSIETQRRANETDGEQRRSSPAHSPKLTPRRNGSDQTSANRSPRTKKPTAEICLKEKITTLVIAEDESSSISDSTVSTSSQTDTEKSKMEEYKEGRSLLERCDKLLHSIAEMNATELQPSPVSVLDSSFYKDELSSPSPVMKRSIDFKDQSVELEEEMWSPAISSVESKCEDESDDCDYLYISDILRASSYLPEDSDVFSLLEEQHYLKGSDTSKVSRLQRRLIFDTVTEIVDRNRQLPPWKATNSDLARPLLRLIWSEFQKIRERDTAVELFEIVCGVLKKDLAGDAANGWGDCPVETSEAVLDIERLIYKDLVGETIRDLVEFAGKSGVSAPRRKLIF
ncbi:hypothetical protein RJ640_019679 [Escallonia rubra]|uniref:DUF4378 domain-containing protein n=1 Tax=Escallonia rubra TaxID=112253 RepID=A0AA88UJB1_9ASTE|nr:hypothetical protein RJ640_019679 [Escallonia rubra]